MSFSSSRRGLILALVFFLFSATGCSLLPAQQSGGYVAPTVSVLFGTVPSLPLAEPTTIVRPIPITTPNPTAVAAATITSMDEDQLLEVPVYTDALMSDWSIAHSVQSDITVNNRLYVDHGKYSIRVKPLYGMGKLYFTLNKTAKEKFLRSRVQGVRFYLSGGSRSINNDMLAVSVIGSNARSYWIPNDTSVYLEGRVTDDQPLFSETLLVFLGINTAIPARTYVEVTVWLDSLLYDPSYKYVTGFYLKADKQFVSEFYVDNVSLLLLPDKR